MESVQMLIKPSSGTCNMRCSYCFYWDEMEKRETKNFGFMTEETLECLVRRAFSSAGDQAGFTFQGGEPTLVGLPFYKRLMELEEQYNVRRIPVANAIQTNGYGLNEEWSAFFAEHHFLVGISLDGTKYTHDAFRLDGGGRGTFGAVMAAIGCLERHGVEYNILTVVNKRTAAAVRKLYAFYVKNGFQYLQFIPCLDPLGETPGGHGFSLTPEEYGEFLVQLFDLWYVDLQKGKQPFIRQFENYVSILMGLPAEACDMRGCCSLQYVTEADGSVYPCDFYVTEEFCLGNIRERSLEELAESGEAKRFLAEGSLRAACAGCEYAFLCRGGCRRYWSGGANYFCPSYRRFFQAALPRLQEIAGRLRRLR